MSKMFLVGHSMGLMGQGFGQHLVLVLSCSFPLTGTASSILIGAVPTSSNYEFFHAWKPTFETYLIENVMFDKNQSMSFTLTILNQTSAFDAVSTKNVDFLFVNPSLYSCMDLEFSGDKQKS